MCGPNVDGYVAGCVVMGLGSAVAGGDRAPGSSRVSLSMEGGRGVIVQRRRVWGIDVAMPRLAGGGVMWRVEVPHTEIREMGCGRCVAEINILNTARSRR